LRPESVINDRRRWLRRAPQCSPAKRSRQAAGKACTGLYAGDNPFYKIDPMSA
jgi:hypothetical protein